MSRPPTGDPGPDHWITEEGPGSSGPGRPEVDVDPATLVDASAFAIILPATDPGPPGGPPATGSDDDDRTRASVQGLGGDPGRLEIPGFRILRELGRGGMGVVYEAIELALSRRVALKVMPPQIASNGKAAERFRREARSAAKLHHTNIVPIFGVGPNEGTLYYAMQLIEGESLDRVIARLGRTSQAGGDAGRPRPSPGLDPTEMGDAPPAGPRADSPPSARPSYDRDREVARVGLQVAEALEHAHDQGILHRDIKPSNLLFDRRGVIWVTDFGLAKSFHGADDDLTNTGDFVGTLRFMAPERFSGRSEPRSDLYALGITLYELLTLRPAFAGSDRPSLLQRVLHEEPRHPRSIDRRVSRDLETVILKAMAKEPDRRYANAGDLAEDLRRFLAGETVSARRAGPAVRAWRWARRRPAAAALGLSVAVLLTTLAVVSTLAAVRIGQARDALRRTLYISRMNLAGQAWESANMGRLRELLAPYRDEAPDADLRSFEWAYWWGLAHPSRLRKSLDVHSGFVVGLAYSADGKTLATVGGDDLVRLTDWASGVARWSGPVHSPMFNKPLAWSPRGNLLATEGPEGSVLVRDSATGRVEARLDRGWEPRGARPSILAFRPDGVLIAVIDGDRAILWAPGEADFRSIMLAGASPAKSRTCQAISTDGRLLAIGDLDGGVRLWDLIDGSSRGEVLAHASAVRSLAFSADGSTLASGGQDTLIRLWDVARLAPRGEPLRGHQISPWMLDFSPDGGTLASACLDNTVRLWDVASGTPAGILKGHDSAVYCVRFAPDGRHLATAGLDRRIRIWDFEESGPPSEIAVDPVGGDTLRFLDDGRAIASADRDATIKTWDTLRGGSPLRILKPESGGESPTPTSLFESRVLGMDLSPVDGKSLVAARNDGVLETWDASEGRLLRRLATGLGAIDSVAFSPDGRTLATSGPGARVTLRDPATLRESRTLAAGHPSDKVRQVAFAPDGASLLAVDRSGALFRWDTKGWGRSSAEADRDSARMEGSGRLAIAPDGRTAAVGLIDGSTTLWDIPTLRPREQLPGHGGQVMAATFSPDGRTLATASRDRTIKLWDVASGELKTTLAGHGSNVLGVAFSPDGTVLASIGLDGMIRFWRAPSEPFPTQPGQLGNPRGEPGRRLDKPRPSP